MEKTKKKGKKWKIILFVVLALILILILSAVISTYKYLQNFKKEDEAKKAEMPGNASQYAVENIQPHLNRPLEGMDILFLGSSVTEGACSMKESFVEYLVKLDGIDATKEAVSSTTLVDEFSPIAFVYAGDGRSYISRIKENVDKSAHFDAVVIQLSTNDATNGKPLGELGDSKAMTEFDTKTVTGAIEYLIAYVQETWNCPVIFYTGTYYESEAYAAMVDRLWEIGEKWDIGVIDLYNDKDLNNISEDTYSFYMYDQIHPTRAGYLEWWTPAIEAYLYDYLI